MEELVTMLLKEGISGLIAGISLYVAWKKDQQVAALYERMVELTERSTDRYHAAMVETQKAIVALEDQARE